MSAKAIVDQLLAHADGFEDLRAAVGVESGDAHLAHDLEQALVHCLCEVFQALFDGDRPGLAPFADDVGDGRIGEVWVDRVGAVADEAGKVMDLPRLARWRR